ncbi:DUF4249 domain-containing protein, partial [Hymenobacter persicinus]
QPGTYRSASLALATGTKVRLRIRTGREQEYGSDFVAVKTTPPIDSVTWRVAANKVLLYVHAHDDTRQARYYRWTYDQTWEYTSVFQSFWELRDGKMQPRTEDVYHCWGSQSSNTLRIFSTRRLEQDVVSAYPLTTLESIYKQLLLKYSVIVQQRALSAEEYAYWEAVGKSTEQIGGLYDPLPTQVKGNVRNLSDPDEVVLGYVGAQAVTQKRIFISKQDLPASITTWQAPNGFEPEPCMLLAVSPRTNLVTFFRGGKFQPIEQLPDGGYTYSMNECVDCRLNGTNVKPDFWP